MGLSDIVWVDGRSGSEDKTKTKQAMHFDIKRSYEQKHMEKLKCVQKMSFLKK